MNYFFGIAYSLIVALSAVLVHAEIGVFPVSVMLLMSTLFAIVVFHFMNLFRLPVIYKKLWGCKRLWFEVMAVIAWVWLCTMYGYSLTPPLIFTLLFFTTGFFFGIIFKVLQGKLSIKKTIFFSGVVVCVVAFIVYDFFQTNVAVTGDTILGMALAILGGLAVFIYSKQSYRLSQKIGLTSSEILAVRFWLLLVIAIILTFLNTVPIIISIHSIFILLLIALLTMVVPLLCFQESIIRAGPERTVILTALVPSFSYLISAVHLHAYRFSILAVSLIFTLTIGLAEILSKR